jgi:hypothetical protein
MKKVLYWLPRILAIAYILFIAVFALDAFEEPQWLLALFFHLIPNYILILCTLIAWKHERVGGVLFLAAACAMAFFFHSIILAIPVFLVGILFLAATL